MLAVIVLAMLVFGSAFAVAGIYVLLGIGWTLIAAGVLLCAGAYILRGGLALNG